MKELICIVCPRGCHLTVDETQDYAVSGNRCPRGAVYGHNELTNPTRVVTSTVRIEGALYPRLPVKTDRPVKKSAVFSVMEQINRVSVQAPVRIGTVLVRNIAGTGADLVAAKNA